MTKRELIELIADFHDLDELRIMSRSGKALSITAVDMDLSIKVGRIVMIADWGKDDDGKQEQILTYREKEKLEPEREKRKYVLTKKRKPVKKKATGNKGVTKRGRPKKKEGE